MKVRLELTPLCYSYINDAVLMLINGDLHKKSIEVCLLQPHFHSKARQVSTTVKWCYRKLIESTGLCIKLLFNCG